MFNKRTKIKELLTWAPQGQDVTVMGWVRTFRNNQFVASGVYFYVVEAANGQKHTGKFTVVQFAR